MAIKLQYNDQDDGVQLISPAEWTTPLCKKKWGLKSQAGSEGGTVVTGSAGSRSPPGNMLVTTTTK